VQILIDIAAIARVDDIITLAVHNDDSERGVHLVGRILQINPEPHPDIIEFKVKLLAHCDGNTGEQDVGMKPWRKIGIIRG